MRCVDNAPHHIRTFVRCTPLAFTVLLFAIGNFFLATTVRIGSDEFAGFVFGLAFSQIVLIVVCLALLAVGLFTRLFIAMALLLLTSGAVFACVLRSTQVSIALSIAAAMIAQSVVYQIPLWSIRFVGWQLVSKEIQRDSFEQVNESQFGIMHLLIWTGIVAAFLAVTRTALSGMKWTDSTGEAITLFVVLSAMNSILVLPFIWACLLERNMGLWMLMAVIWTMLLTPLELSIVSFAGISGIHSVFFVVMNIVQVIAVAWSLLTLRCAGFRLLAVRTAHAETME